MNDINNMLLKLSKSTFRSSFHLRKYMVDYVNEKGMDKVKSHAYDFIKKNIAPKNPKNDGRQTPLKNHPVFIAQHACACCCRNCLLKWHGIKKGVELDDKQIDYIVNLLMKWIENEMKSNHFNK